MEEKRIRLEPFSSTDRLFYLYKGDDIISIIDIRVSTLIDAEGNEVQPWQETKNKNKDKIN